MSPVSKNPFKPSGTLRYREDMALISAKVLES